MREAGIKVKELQLLAIRVYDNRIVLERTAIVGDSPVGEIVVPI